MGLIKRKSAKRFIICLCLAPVLVVAVAWAIHRGFAINFFPQRGHYYTPISITEIEPGRCYEVMRLEHDNRITFFATIGDVFESSFGRDDPPETILEEWAWNPFVDAWDGTVRQCSDTASGWPYLALHCRLETWDPVWTPDQPHQNINLTKAKLTNGVSLDGPPHGNSYIEDFLPIGVFLPGFIGNALLYAVVMWGVWTGVAATFRGFKRRRRVRRGLCPACTYDLTGLGSAECPECGETLYPSEPESA